MIKRIIYSLLPIIGGAIVGLITSGYMDYQDIVKPPLSPSGIVFPIVWTILYILMGTSYFLATKDNEDNKEIRTDIENLFKDVIGDRINNYSVESLKSEDTPAIILISESLVTQSDNIPKRLFAFTFLSSFSTQIEDLYSFAF